METKEYQGISFTKIKGFTNYYISRCGKILSTHYYNGTNERIISSNKTPKGYISCSLLIKKGSNKPFLVHRLLAQTFIPNPDNKPHVNHLDGNKMNCSLNNLEWCTPSENEIHSYRILNKKPIKTGLGKFGVLHHNSKKVQQFDLNNNLIKTWDSVAEIYRELGIRQGNIYSVSKGKRNHAGGYKWKII